MLELHLFMVRDTKPQVRVLVDAIKLHDLLILMDEPGPCVLDSNSRCLFPP